MQHQPSGVLGCQDSNHWRVVKGPGSWGRRRGLGSAAATARRGSRGGGEPRPGPCPTQAHQYCVPAELKAHRHHRHVHGVLTGPAAGRGVAAAVVMRSQRGAARCETHSQDRNKSQGGSEQDQAGRGQSHRPAFFRFAAISMQVTRVLERHPQSGAMRASVPRLGQLVPRVPLRGQSSRHPRRVAGASAVLPTREESRV